MKKAKAKTQSLFQRFTKRSNVSKPVEAAAQTHGLPSIRVTTEQPSETKGKEVIDAISTSVTSYVENKTDVSHLTAQMNSPIIRSLPIDADELSLAPSTTYPEKDRDSFYCTPNASSTKVHTCQLTLDADLRTSRMVATMSELNEAVSEFRNNYQQYAAKNRQFVLIENDLHGKLQNIHAHGRLGETAQVFGDQIWEVMRGIESKKEISKKKWTTKLGIFSSKLFPIVSLSLNLADAVSQVSSN